MSILKFCYYLRCRFTIITSDGSLQQIEISYGQSSSTFPKCTFNRRCHLCNDVFCFDCHHELNLFVAVHKNSGMFLVIFSIIFNVTLVLVVNLSSTSCNRLIDVSSLLLLTVGLLLKEIPLSTW